MLGVHVLYPPLKGEDRIALSEAKCDPGRGGGTALKSLLLGSPHPGSLRSPTLPLQAWVKKSTARP
jgi:hypothetical protein